MGASLLSERTRKEPRERPWPEMIFSGLALLLVAFSLSQDPRSDLKRHVQTLARTPEATPAPLRGAPLSEPPIGGAPTPQAAPTDPEQRALFAQDPAGGERRVGYSKVEFGLLAGFKAGVGVPLPSAVAALDGQAVTLTGSMVPVAFRDDKISAFVLVRNQLLCCYGQQPLVNEWVFVECAVPVKPLMEEPVQLFGRLTVEPDVRDDELICLYRMKAEDVQAMP